MRKNFADYNSNENWDILAAAIVKKAIEDYYDAKYKLDTLDSKQLNENAHERKRNNLLAVIKDVESFFNSSWFKTIIPDFDGKKIFALIQDRYENEIRDMMKNGTYIKRGLLED